MRKPFDLKYYLAHPNVKVVTRDGRSARILCTDLNRRDCPVVASCPNTTEDLDDLFTCTTTGKLLPDTSIVHPNDLFFDLPDPVMRRVPLTYEDLLERVKAGKTMWIDSKDELIQIVNFDEHKIIAYLNFYGKNINLKDTIVMQSYRFVDGDPCWKEVER